MSKIVLVKGRPWTLDAALAALFGGSIDEEDVIEEWDTNDLGPIEADDYSEHARPYGSITDPGGI